MDDGKRKIWHEFMNACVFTPSEAPGFVTRYPDILSWRDGVGETALHHLAIEDYVEAVRLLIHLGADVNTQCDFGDTPLASAAMLGHANMCCLLLTHHASAETCNVNVEAPLHYAARNAKCVDALRVLLESGANGNIRDDFGKTPLHEAAGRGNLLGAKTLIAFGVDVNARSTWDGPPILCVEGVNAMALVKLLLEHGADLHVTNEGGDTLLHHAAFHGLQDVVRFCLDNGFDPDARNEDGQTPADEAKRGAKHRARYEAGEFRELFDGFSDEELGL